MEVEPVRTLATVKGVERRSWDSLGEVLFVELVVGPPDIDRTLPVSLTPEGAEELLRALQECLEERPGIAGPEH
jgi:hypothetical protein